MASDIGHLKPQERQFSDVTAVQAPVQDNSSAMKMSAFAAGIEGGANKASTLYSIYDKQQEMARRAALEQQEIDFANRYNHEIDRMSYAVQSGEFSDLAAQTHLTKVKRELVASGADVNKLIATEAASLKTLSGRALEEGSRQKQLEDIEWDQYQKSNWALPSSATMDEHKAQMLRMQKSEARDLELAAKKREAEFNRLRQDASKSERDQAEQALKDLTMTEISNKLGDFVATFPQEATRIAESYRAEVLELGEAGARANAERSLQTFITQATVAANLEAAKVEGGAKAQMAVFNDTIEKLQSQFMDNIGDVRLSKKLKEVQAEQEIKTQFAVYNSHESVPVLAALNDIVPHAMAHMGSLATTAYREVNNHFVENATRNPGDPSFRAVVGSPAQKATFKAYSDAVKAYNEGSYEGDVRSLEKQVSGQLAYVADNLPRLKHSEVNAMLKDLESPDFGKFIKARGLTNEDLDNVNRVMFDFKEDVADGFTTTLQEMLSELGSRNRSRTRRGAIAAANVAEIEDLDIVFESGQVIVKALKPMARDEARELTRRVGGQLTRVVRVDSNLSGESQESVFNSWKESLWPSEEEEPTTEE